MTEVDRRFLEFGLEFEINIIGHAEPRSLEESLAAGWRGLRLLPREELHRLSDTQIERHLGADAGAEGKANA